MFEEYLIVPVYQVLAVLLVGVLSVYWFFTKDYGRFEVMGLKSLKPQFFFGNVKAVLNGEVTLLDFYRDLYFKFEGERCAVFYEGRHPVLLPRDADLIKRITTTDADHFESDFIPEGLKHLPQNDFGLINRDGDKWRSMRATTGSAFSPSKLKFMRDHINQAALEAVEVMRPNAASGEPLLIDNVMNLFVTDCLSRTVYSVNVGALKNPENDFSKLSRGLLNPESFAWMTLAPRLAGLLKIELSYKYTQDRTEFFVNFTRNMIKQRRQNPPKEKLHDMLELLLEITDAVNDDEAGHEATRDWAGGRPKKSYPLTEFEIARILLQVILDGQEAIANQVSLCFYYLALNPDVQQRAYQEIEEVAAQADGEDRELLTSEAVHSLKYLDAVLSESLRLGPFPFTFRRCAKEYRLPGMEGVVVPKGMRVMLPICGIQVDSRYWPDPYKFDPERFYDPKKKSKQVLGSYLSFGIGPRACTGPSIVRVQAKAIMYQVLKNFIVEPCKKTVDTTTWSKESWNRVEGGNWVRVVPRT